MRKLIVGAVATASIVGGAIGIAAVSPLGLAGAQDNPGTTVPTPVPASPGTPAAPGHPGHPGQPGHRPGGAGPLAETLKELVANGTITQAQADAITEKMKSKVGPGHGGKEGRGFGMGKEIGATAAAAIGIDVQTLMTELKDGKSLADVARAHNVDPQKVIDALVAKATSDIDNAVADGKLSAEKAAAAKAKLVERTTGLVNGQFKGGPGGPGRHGPMDGTGKGRGSEPTPADPGDPSTPAPPTSAAPSTPVPSTPAPTTAAPTTSPASSAPAPTSPTTAAPGPGTTAG